MQQQTRSTLDVIYENWGGYNKKLCDCVAPLTDKQLLLQPAARMWPLGQIVQHIVSVRAGWFSGTLQDPDEAMNEYVLWGQPDSPARRAMELVRGLDETWAFILARLQRWTPDDLTLMTRCVIFSYDALRYKRVFTRLLNLQVNCSSYADKA